MKNKSKLIVYLDRQKLVLSGTQFEKPLTLEFPQSIVVDIDIIDPEGFVQLLSNFISQSEVISSEIILVISDEVYYEKNIALSKVPEEKQRQIDLFLETVPFKNLIYKDYILGDSPKLITLNKNYYEPIVKFFEINGFNILAIVPLFVLNFFQLKLDTFTSDETKNIYNKYKMFAPFSLVTTEDIDKITTVKTRGPKEDNTRAIILLVIFCILFVGLLGYMFLRPYILKPTQRQVPPVVMTTTPTPIVSEPTSIPTISINYLSSELIKFKIVNSSGIPNQVAKIKQSLVDQGFLDIKTFSSSLVTATKNQISFSPKVSPESRQKIKTVVEALAGSSGDSETVSTTDFDVVIVTTLKPSN